jgi:hypothetical protein
MTQMKPSRRSRIGLRLAQLGGVLMMVGGAGDMTIRRLLPGHIAFLGVSPDHVPATTEGLVLSLLHALGASLVASGLAVLVLVQQARLSGHRLPLFTAAGVAVLAEGVNAAGIYRIGSPLFVAPLSFMLLVLLGVALCLIPRWELRSSA